MLRFQKKNSIFAQGDATDGLFFIQRGKVRLSVVSEAGKEATLGILNEGDFFGEGGLAVQLQRYVVGNCYDRLRSSPHREEGDDAGNEPGAETLGHVPEASAKAKYPISG